MVNCTEIKEFFNRVWTWIWRQREFRPCFFVLCVIIFVLCIFGYHACDHYEFPNNTSRLIWRGFWAFALSLDVAIFGINILNYCLPYIGYRLRLSAYEEI